MCFHISLLCEGSSVISWNVVGRFYLLGRFFILRKLSLVSMCYSLYISHPGLSLSAALHGTLGSYSMIGCLLSHDCKELLSLSLAVSSCVLSCWINLGKRGGRSLLLQYDSAVVIRISFAGATCYSSATSEGPTVHFCSVPSSVIPDCKSCTGNCTEFAHLTLCCIRLSHLWQSPSMVRQSDNHRQRVLCRAVSTTRGDCTLCLGYSFRPVAAFLHLGTYTS